MGKPQRVSDLVTSDFSDYYSSKKNKSLSDYSDYKSLSTKRNKTNYTEAQARSRAQYLAEKLNNPSRIMLYLKCAWNLTDVYLDRLLAIALTKDDPVRYFSKAAFLEMQNNK